jgi:K+-transporting ATPase ATPase C chain
MTTSIVRPAALLLIVLTLLLGVVYPLLVTGIAQAAFPDKSAGSLIFRDGKPIGSRLIGQSFTAAKYFWGRPSATGDHAYNATASGGSNQGPLNPALVDAVKQRIVALRAADPGNTLPVPVDLVTASGSGLDPEVSVAAIEYQIPRVARARNMRPEDVRALAGQHTKDQTLGFFGEPRVNVVELNLALDAAKP